MEFDSELDWRHGSKNVNFVFAFISFIGRVHNVSIEVKFEVVTSGIIFINETEKEVSLAVIQVLVSSPSLQAVNQVFVGVGIHFKLVKETVVIYLDTFQDRVELLVSFL